MAEIFSSTSSSSTEYSVDCGADIPCRLCSQIYTMRGEVESEDGEICSRCRVQMGVENDLKRKLENAIDGLEQEKDRRTRAEDMLKELKKEMKNKDKKLKEKDEEMEKIKEKVVQLEQKNEEYEYIKKIVERVSEAKKKGESDA